MEKNDIVTLTVTDMTDEGLGVGRIDGLAVFVSNAVPGDTVSAVITKVLARLAYAKTLEVLTPSPDRITPPCHNFPACGGCNLQHITYEAELAYKENRVRGCLSRIAKTDCPIKSIIGAPEGERFRYRNKAQFPITADGIGFFAPRSHRLIPISDCLITNPLHPKIIDAVFSWMKAEKLTPYDEESGRGNLRHLFTRTSKKTGDILLILVTKESKRLSVDHLLERLQQDNIPVTGIVQNINPKPTNVILGRENVLLYGNGFLTDAIGDLDFEISPHSFFQIHPGQTKRLYDAAMELCDLKGSETVIDLYCGIGTITLTLAQKAKSVIGVEVVPQSIIDARDNARRNNIHNVEFIEGAAETVLPKLVQEGVRPDLIVVDPPRKGCDERMLRAAIDSGVPKIVYISCNPATLARDIAYLEANGFSAQVAQPVDLFPRTVHVETVVLLSR